MHQPRPYSSQKVFAVFFFNKVSLLYAFVIYVIPLFDLDAGINDRHKMNTPSLHLLYELRKLGKRALVNCKVLVPLHVIDIHIDHIERNSGFLIFIRNFSDFVRSHVTPSALTKAKGPLRRYIAASDNSPELRYNVKDTLALNDIDIRIEVLKDDTHLVQLGITYIKADLPGSINVNAKLIFLGKDNEEVLGGIERVLVLCVIGVIGVIAGIKPAPFIHAPYSLSKTVHSVIFL